MPRLSHLFILRLIALVIVAIAIATLSASRADDILQPWEVKYKDAGTPKTALCKQQGGWCFGPGCLDNTFGYQCGNTIPAYIHRQNENYYGYCEGATGTCIFRTEVFCSREGLFAERIEGNCSSFVCFGYTVMYNACDFNENL